MFEKDSWLVNPNKWYRWMRIFEDNPFNLPPVPDVSGHIKAGVRALRETVPEYEERKEAEALAEEQQPWVDYGDTDSAVGSPTDIPAKEAEMARQARKLGLEADMVPGYGFIPRASGESKKDDDEEMNLMEQAYLLSLMESMRGEDIGQAPAVVAGGGQRQWPSMMGQFRPWEQQKPYWWIR